MRTLTPQILVLASLAALAGCEQRTQRLPFSPDEDLIVTRVISPDGGLVSHPAGISIRFPRDAVDTATTVTIYVRTRLTDFPASPEGAFLEETYFEVTPIQMAMARPIEVNLAIEPDSLSDEEQVRLGFATEDRDVPITTEGVTFDLTAGILRGKLDILGAMAAVIAKNGVPVARQTPPVLAGGPMSGGASGAPAPAERREDGSSASAAANAFATRCGHTGNVRRCIDSGDIEVWASAEIQNRLDAAMFLMNPNVDGSLEFTDFVNGAPTKAQGRLSVTGTLRVQLGQAITSFTVDDTFVTTGAGGRSDVTVTGNTITIHSTSVGERSIEFEVRPSGTGEQLVVRGEKSVDFENEDGTTVTASLFVDMRLRR
jgi:hypothetical protein